MLDYYIATWRNWLAQEAYTFKVTGSSPVVATKKKDAYRKPSPCLGCFSAATRSQAGDATINL